MRLSLRDRGKWHLSIYYNDCGVRAARAHTKVLLIDGMTYCFGGGLIVPRETCAHISDCYSSLAAEWGMTHHARLLGGEVFHVKHSMGA